MTDPTIPSLARTSLLAMLLSVFAVSAGFGIVLPILPFLIEQFAGQNDLASIGSHTGLLMGVYVLAVFLFAPLWGAISDRRGRKPVILLGLSGFAVTVFVLAKAENLPVLYLGRFLSGAFSAAVTPAAFALIGDHAPDMAWRARRFALVNIAGSLGFFIGPMIGGLAVRSSAVLAGGIPATAPSAPFVAAAALATVAALVALLSLPSATPRRAEGHPAETPSANKGATCRLLAIAFATAYAVGSFEVDFHYRERVSVLTRHILARCLPSAALSWQSCKPQSFRPCSNQRSRAGSFRLDLRCYWSVLSASRSSRLMVRWQSRSD
jgi:MFS family permease